MVNDSGTYLCHISTDPPLIRYVHLEISGNILFMPKLKAFAYSPIARLRLNTFKEKEFET